MLNKIKSFFSNLAAKLIPIPAPSTPQQPGVKPGSLEWYTNLMNVCVITPARMNELKIYANAIIDSKIRLMAMEKVTGVPWYMLGLIQSHEAGIKGGQLNFLGCMHNGEEIIGTIKKTTLVPAGRGPFKTWEESCIDACGYDGLTNIKTWSVDVVLQYLERFNGTGYLQYHTSTLSPYLWGGTNLYTKGKYVADHKFDPNAVSQQIGCGAIIKYLIDMKEI